MEIEDKLIRLQKTSRVISGISLALFLILIAYGSWRLREIYREIDTAQHQLAAAQEERTRVKEEIGKLNAELETKKKQIAATNTVLGNLRNMAPANLQEAITHTVSADPAAAKALPRVYLHIGQESQRNDAKQIAAALQAEGYVVPGIENVGKNMTKNMELRYCKDKGNETDVERIDNLLATIKATKPIVRVLDLPSCSDVTSSRSYELWLGLETGAR